MGIITHRLSPTTVTKIFNNARIMKRTFKSLFIFAAAALTLAGCQKTENDIIQNDGPFKYSFAIAEDGTRAIIGDKNILLPDSGEFI